MTKFQPYILVGILASLVPYYDLDPYRGHLHIGANFFSLVKLLI